MKKIISLFLFLLVTWSPMAMADENFNVFAGLGEILGTEAGQRAYLKGDVKRKVWFDKKYDFSKMKKFLIITGNKCGIYDAKSNKEIIVTHNVILQDIMRNKYQVCIPSDIDNYVMNRFPQLKPGCDEYRKQGVRFIMSMDAFIAVDIYTFNVRNDMTNVSYEIVVSPMNDIDKKVFVYKESRFNVPYKSGYQLFGEIVEKFMPKFEKCLKSKKSNDD